MLHFVKKALFSLVSQTKMSSVFGTDHEFYGLKASQMSEVCASSHEYPHVEKIKNLRKQNFKGEENNKQLDSNKATSVVNI